jgi:hypothetical protein
VLTAIGGKPTGFISLIIITEEITTIQRNIGSPKGLVVGSWGNTTREVINCIIPHSWNIGGADIQTGAEIHEHRRRKSFGEEISELWT